MSSGAGSGAPAVAGAGRDRADTIVAKVRELVQDELIAHEPELLGRSFRAILPRLEAWRRLVKESGLWAPWLPTRYGGLGLPLVAYARISEELGRSPYGHYVFNCQAPDVGNMELLIAHGSEEQKREWLLPLVQGEARSCFAMTEPEHAGSNPVHMSTQAKRDGDTYVVDGHKWFTSGAEGSIVAIVMAVTNPEAGALHARASQILVPMTTPGVTRVRNVSVMGEAGEDWWSHAEMRFEGVRVPVANRIGQEGAGFALAQERLGPGRIHHCMRWIGISERALEMMCRRAASRELAPGDFLSSRQTVEHWVAESRAEIEASRMLVLKAAHTIEAGGTHAAREEISMIKFYVAGVLQRVLDRAVQVHGALGLTDDTPLALWWRHERAARIYDGPDEVHKSVVARAVMKRYGLSTR